MSKMLFELKYQVRFGLPIWLISTLTLLLPDIGPFIRLRGVLISIFLPGRPKGFLIGRDVTLLNVNNLYVGKNVYFAKGTWINALGGVTIEDEVSLAPYVVISSTNHGFKNGSVFRGGTHPKAVKIGRGSWLAAHSVVTAGSIIGSGVLLGANSVANGELKNSHIYGGVPAKEIKHREDNPSNITTKSEV